MKPDLDQIEAALAAARDQLTKARITLDAALRRVENAHQHVMGVGFGAARTAHLLSQVNPTDYAVRQLDIALEKSHHTIAGLDRETLPAQLLVVLTPLEKELTARRSAAAALALRAGRHQGDVRAALDGGQIDDIVNMYSQAANQLSECDPQLSEACEATANAIAVANGLGTEGPNSLLRTGVTPETYIVQIDLRPPIRRNDRDSSSGRAVKPDMNRRRKRSVSKNLEKEAVQSAQDGSDAGQMVGNLTQKLVQRPPAGQAKATTQQSVKAADHHSHVSAPELFSLSVTLAVIVMRVVNRLRRKRS